MLRRVCVRACVRGCVFGCEGWGPTEGGRLFVWAGGGRGWGAFVEDRWVGVCVCLCLCLCL